MAVFDVERFAACFVSMPTLKLVELALEEDEESLLFRLRGILLEESNIEKVADVFELGNYLLAWKYDLPDVETTSQDRPTADRGVGLAL